MGDTDSLDVRALLERIDEHTHDTNERVKQLEKTIFFGNGEPSVLARVAAIESSASTTRWLIGLASVLGPTLVSIIFFVVSYLAKR